MKKQSLKKQLALITGLLSTELLLLGFANIHAQRRLSFHLHQIIFNDVPRAQLLALINEVHDAIRSTAVDSMLASVTRDRNRVRMAREKFEQLRSDSQKYFEELNGKQNSKELELRLEIVLSEFRSYLAAGDDLTGAAEEGIRNLSAPLKDLDGKFLQLEKSLQELGALYASDKDNRSARALKFARRASQIAIFTLLMAIASGVAFAWWVNKHFVEASAQSSAKRPSRPQFARRAA